MPLIEKLGKDENVKAIVLRVDSPGGSAMASDLIWRALEASNKPFVASMGDTAASGVTHTGHDWFVRRFQSPPDQIAGQSHCHLGCRHAGRMALTFSSLPIFSISGTILSELIDASENRLIGLLPETMAPSSRSTAMRGSRAGRL